jgi:hypothetical protein
MSARGRWSKSLRALALPLFLAVQSWAAQAHAGSRILLLEFGGPKGDVLRGQVEKSLQDAGNTVVLSDRSGKGLSRSALARLARDEGTDVVVVGIVQHPSMKKWVVTLRVHDANRGKKLGADVRFQESWLPGLAKELTEGAADRLGKSIDRATGSKSKRATRSTRDQDDSDSLADDADLPPEPEGDTDLTERAPLTPKRSAKRAEPEPESEAEEASDDAGFESDPGSINDDQSGAGDGRRSRILGAFTARAGLVHRKFDFSDDIYERLRKQNANIWVYQAQAEVYPFDAPVADRLGLIARYEGVFSGNVKDSDFGGNFPVVYDEIFAGLRARYPLGGHMVGFDLTFGRMRAGLDDPQHRSNMPEVNYTQLRSSLDVNLDFDVVHATASAAFRLPLGYGEVSDANWFPRVGGYGVEASGGLEYPLSQHFSLELSASLRRYLLEMNSEPQDAVEGVAEVAGGAVDLYTAAYFGLSFRL